MPIKSAHLQNFTVFKELQVNFTKGDKIVIAEIVGTQMALV